MSNRKVTRDAVIKTLTDALKPLDYVHAFYESGAKAFNRVDEWSDIDLYVVVEDEKVNDAFDTVEIALKSLSSVKEKFAVAQLPWPGVSQAFYRLEHASEYLLIDLAVVKLSGPEKFLEPQIHGKAVFYFNKSNKVKVPILNKEELAKNLRQKLARLRDRFSMFNIFVQKEINREETLRLWFFTKAPLWVQLLTCCGSSTARFIMISRHATCSMSFLRRLLGDEQLYFVKDGRDLLKKYREATKWFNEISSP